MKMRQYNIFSLIAALHGWYGPRSTRLGVLPKLSSVSNIFGNWLNGIPKDYNPLVLVGAAALCWSIRRCRNAVVFYNKKHSFLQVIFATTHWLRTWAILQRPSSQDTLVAASHFLAQVAKDFFAWVHGWQSSLRIDSY